MNMKSSVLVARFHISRKKHPLICKNCLFLISCRMDASTRIMELTQTKFIILPCALHHNSWASGTFLLPFESVKARCNQVQILLVPFILNLLRQFCHFGWPSSWSFSLRIQTGRIAVRYPTRRPMRTSLGGMQTAWQVRSLSAQLTCFKNEI